MVTQDPRVAQHAAAAGEGEDNLSANCALGSSDSVFSYCDSGFGGLALQQASAAGVDGDLLDSLAADLLSEHVTAIPAACEMAAGAIQDCRSCIDKLCLEYGV